MRKVQHEVKPIIALTGSNTWSTQTNSTSSGELPRPVDPVSTDIQELAERSVADPLTTTQIGRVRNNRMSGVDRRHAMQRLNKVDVRRILQNAANDSWRRCHTCKLPWNTAYFALNDESESNTYRASCCEIVAIPWQSKRLSHPREKYWQGYEHWACAVSECNPIDTAVLYVDCLAPKKARQCFDASSGQCMTCHDTLHTTRENRLERRCLTMVAKQHSGFMFIKRELTWARSRRVLAGESKDLPEEFRTAEIDIYIEPSVDLDEWYRHSTIWHNLEPSPIRQSERRMQYERSGEIGKRVSLLHCCKRLWKDFGGLAGSTLVHKTQKMSLTSCLQRLKACTRIGGAWIKIPLVERRSMTLRELTETPLSWGCQVKEDMFYNMSVRMLTKSVPHAQDFRCEVRATQVPNSKYGGTKICFTDDSSAALHRVFNSPEEKFPGRDESENEKFADMDCALVKSFIRRRNHAYQIAMSCRTPGGTHDPEIHERVSDKTMNLVGSEDRFVIVHLPTMHEEVDLGITLQWDAVSTCWEVTKIHPPATK